MKVFMCYETYDDGTENRFSVATNRSFTSHKQGVLVENACSKLSQQKFLKGKAVFESLYY